MSILESGDVLKTTDFDVHWFVNRQHFINPPELRLREPAVVRNVFKPAARRPNAKASSTARGSIRSELTDRNNVEAARPLGRVSFLALHKLRCERSLETVYLAAATNSCSCRRANVLCGKWCHKGDLTDAKLEDASRRRNSSSLNNAFNSLPACYTSHK
ncbi:hypothetical protein E4U46_006183 [Claviceps purpurea]|nr:hypothetical protein E4U46_006183 [Claviceps purpurea]